MRFEQEQVNQIFSQSEMAFHPFLMQRPSDFSVSSLLTQHQFNPHLPAAAALAAGFGAGPHPGSLSSMPGVPVSMAGLPGMSNVSSVTYNSAASLLPRFPHGYTTAEDILSSAASAAAAAHLLSSTISSLSTSRANGQDISQAPNGHPGSQEISKSDPFNVNFVFNLKYTSMSEQHFFTLYILIFKYLRHIYRGVDIIQ